MIEQDTIKLMRECDAGIKMGIASIDDVLPHVNKQDFCNKLTQCREEHSKLQMELQERLDRFQDTGKNPNPIAKSMSKMKTSMKLGMEESDETIETLCRRKC